MLPMMQQHLLEFHAERVPLPETHHAVCTGGGQVPRRTFNSRTKLTGTESLCWLVEGFTKILLALQ